MKPSALDDAMWSNRVRQFFLARQPILHRDHSLFAYELLFRSTETGPANVQNDVIATASVIMHALELGIANVVGDAKVFLNIDATVLTSDIARFMHKEKVVLEILETVRVTDEIEARVKNMAADGYTFALDDVVSNSADVKRLLPYVSIIKIDIASIERDTMVELCHHFKSQGKLLLAEKVETPEEFRMCLDLGFDYFQGYYFAKPAILTGKTLSPSHLTLVELMARATAAKSDEEIENLIKRDATLSLALLRLVNDPASGVRQRVDTISEAMLVMGRRQFLRWLEILIYAAPSAPAMASPLLLLATTRGKLLELIAGRVRPNDRVVADLAFSVGVLSLTDALFGLPMEQIVRRVTIDAAVKEALLSRTGLYGDMLTLAELIEHPEDDSAQVSALLSKLNLSNEEFKELELQAFEWGDKVARSAD
jgi:EAL and modified HD-GYP domain-containing signal transduction protein